MTETHKGRTERALGRLGTVALLALPLSVRAEAGGDFAVDWHTIDCGGGTAAAGDFEVSGTIGQPDAGVMAGGDFTLSGGFWQGGGAPCPADIDGSGDVSTADLLHVLADWGPCPEEGPCPADIDGSGDVSTADLLHVLADWGPCP